MGSDQIENAGVHRRPDRAGAGEVGVEGVGRGRLGHVLDRNDQFHVEGSFGRRIDDLHRPGVPPAAVGSAAAEEASDRLQWALRGGQPDALGRPVGQLLEPLERDCQVGPSLAAGHGVDLVDDDPPHGVEDLARLRGEHEVEGLGRGDEDVWRSALHPGPICARRVPGSEERLELGEVGFTLASGGMADPRQGRPQVAVDVVCERLEGRDVQDPAAVGPDGHRLVQEPVDGVEEGRQRLAGAGGGVDERVASAGDGVPSL